MSNDNAKPDEHEEKSQDRNPQKTTDATLSDSHPAQPPKAKTPKNHDYSKPLLRRILEWWKDPYRQRANVAERFTVLLTFVIAGIGLLQWLVYRQQTTIMGSDNPQTTALITAANISALSAEHNAAAAQSFAQSAAKIDKGIDAAVVRLQAQADATENARKTSDSAATKALNATIDNFHQEQRAWLGICNFAIEQLEENKLINVNVQLCNSGRTPAYQVKSRVGETTAPPPLIEDPSGSIGFIPFVPFNAVPPQGITTIRVGGGNGQVPAGGSADEAQRIVGDVPKILRGELIFYVVGDVSYRDGFSNKTHDTQFCFYLADRTKKVLGYCKSHNELD